MHACVGACHVKPQTQKRNQSLLSSNISSLCCSSHFPKKVHQNLRFLPQRNNCGNPGSVLVRAVPERQDEPSETSRAIRNWQCQQGETFNPSPRATCYKDSGLTQQPFYYLVILCERMCVGMCPRMGGGRGQHGMSILSYHEGVGS